MEKPELICGPDLSLYLWRDFLNADEQQNLLHSLRHDIEWRIDKIKLFGKEHFIPRRQAFIGDHGLSYRYSKLTLNAAAWPTALDWLRNTVIRQCDTPFNCALLNHYRDGQDKMGWHSDDEPELGQNPAIASISLGEARRFVLRHKTMKDCEKVDLTLTSGSLLLMAGTTQHFWQHSVPASKRVHQERYNLTFRYIR